MQTETIIREDDRDGGLSINIFPSEVVDRHLSLEVASSTERSSVTIVVSTEDRIGFLELLRKVTDECLLRLRDDEQKGERDDA